MAASSRVAERRQVRGGRVLPGLGRVARPGDHGADAGLLDHPAERGLGGRGAVRGQGGELTRRLHAGVEVHAGEGLPGVEGLAVPVVAAMVVRRRTWSRGCTGRTAARTPAGPGR